MFGHNFITVLFEFTVYKLEKEGEKSKDDLVFMIFKPNI